MPLPRLLLLVVAASLLTACATYSPKELNPATTHTQLESRRLDDPALERYLADRGQSVTLEWDISRLTLAALFFSPELDIARAQLQEVEAGVRTAQQRPNPAFSFSPAYNTDGTGGVTPWILGYALNLPLEIGGKRAHRTAEARHRAEAARLHLAGAAWSVRNRVRLALTDLDAAQATAELWRGQMPLLADAARLVEAQVGAGEVSPLYASQARIAVNRAELAARESERAVRTARSRLAEALGVPLAALVDVRLSFQGLSEATEPVGSIEARTWAAQNRADILGALVGYGAADSALRHEIARQYPDLNMGPGYELDQGAGKWSLGIGFTLPVFHQNQGPIAAAEARRAVAAAQFIALQNRVLAEVDRAVSDYSAARGDLETVQAMRARLETQAKTVRAQQLAGETSRLDLVRAQIELADLSRAELDARLRASRAIAAVEDAVQRPLAWPEAVWRIQPLRTSAR